MTIPYCFLMQISLFWIIFQEVNLKKAQLLQRMQNGGRFTVTFQRNISRATMRAEFYLLTHFKFYRLQFEYIIYVVQQHNRFPFRCGKSDTRTIISCYKAKLHDDWEISWKIRSRFAYVLSFAGNEFLRKKCLFLVTTCLIKSLPP